MIDPKTRNEVNNVEDIKRISLEYCKEILTKRKPNEGYEEIIQHKMDIHEVRMKERLANEAYDSLTF